MWWTKAVFEGSWKSKTMLSGLSMKYQTGLCCLSYVLQAVLPGLSGRVVPSNRNVPDTPELVCARQRETWVSSDNIVVRSIIEKSSSKSTSNGFVI